MRKTLALAFVAASLTTLTAVDAKAFCGFYVGGAESSLYNDATMVVLMREGTTTVLSMQNSYQGPPENFAMVVPVPVVLQQENVRTLPDAVFSRVDTLAAPRLVEYWEQDPCYVPRPMRRGRRGMPRPTAARRSGGDALSQNLGVTVEAEFEVGEYDIAILSAQDSGGLDTWLRQEGYRIPANAEPALRPYVQSGTKFFVARVDVSRVNFVEGRAVLSPLRVHYDSDTFALPVRLGLINSNGTQDLLVHVLARNQRFEVANYPNVTIPTNISLRPRAVSDFGGFYTALFDKTMEMNPGAVVTEYAWQAGSCDPCPGPVLTDSDIMTLGGDVAGGNAGAQPPGRGRWGGGLAQQFTITRLHYRYGPGGVDEDLVFRAAPAITGGRGMPNRAGRFDRQVVQNASVNNFQGRYAQLHWWRGAIRCEHPRRGLWGGPPNGQAPPPRAASNPASQPRRGIALERYVRRPVRELQGRPRRRRAPSGGGGGGNPPAALDPSALNMDDTAPEIRTASIAGCSVAGAGAAAIPLLGLLAALSVFFVRRRR